jgi:hypothetical protein
MIRVHSILVFACLVAFGFAHAAAFASIIKEEEAALKAKCTVGRDDFKKVTWVRSPDVVFDGDKIVNIYRYDLSAELRDGQQPRYFLTVFSQRGSRQSWAFWRNAADHNGVEFKLMREDEEVLRNGIVQESAYAILSREYLESISSVPLKWRIYGDRVTRDFEIMPIFVAGFLQKCDETFSIATGEAPKTH